jgi:ribosomal protein S18 acetylase RimI-like enzyme
MEVRRLRTGESAIGVEAIQRLKAPDGYPMPTAEYFETFLSRAGNVFVVAIDPEPIGYAVGYLLDRIDRDQRMLFFYEIGVAPSRRREGVGRRLIEVLKAVCRDENVMKMWVPTARSNVAATALYAGTGAVPLPNDDEVTYAYSWESFAQAG